MSTTMNTTWGGLTQGCYEAYVIDDNGCELADTICIGCLGIDIVELNLDLYPNPSDGSFTIESDYNGLAQINIYNLAGALVYTDQLNSNKQVISLDFNAGVYNIILETTTGISRKKLIIE